MQELYSLSFHKRAVVRFISKDNKAVEQKQKEKSRIGGFKEMDVDIR